MAWREQQLPDGDSVHLDHVGFFVHDLESAGARLERLGFRVQPLSVHYDEDPSGRLVRSGTANRLVTFAIGYLEVLSAVADTPLAAQLTAALARYEGLHLVALTHPDVASRGPRFAAAGIPMQPAVELRRPLQTEDGPRQVRATVARCRPGFMAEGRVQMLTHHTPELIWRPGYGHHPNGVDALQELLVISPDPAEASERHRRFSGTPGGSGEGVWRVDLDRGWLGFIDPGAAQAVLPGLAVPALPWCAAVVLRTTDLERTRTALARAGVTPRIDAGDLLCVGPEDGLGAYLVFQPRIDPGVWSHLREAIPG